MDSTMKKNQKIAVGGTSLLVALALGVAAVGTTSAYFSDTNTGGAIIVSSETVATIAVDVNGDPTTTPDLGYAALLPGETQTQTFTLTNTGTSAQDVWVQFPNNGENNQFATFLDTATFDIYVDDDLVWTSDPASGTTAKPPAPAILLTEDLPPDESAEVDFALTLDSDTTSADVQASDKPVTLHYEIVATQPGIEPGA
jgi:hypothetical protein